MWLGGQATLGVPGTSSLKLKVTHALESIQGDLQLLQPGLEDLFAEVWSPSVWNGVTSTTILL